MQVIIYQISSLVNNAELVANVSPVTLASYVRPVIHFPELTYFMCGWILLCHICFCDVSHDLSFDYSVHESFELDILN